MKKQSMYAMCENEKGIMMLLEKGKEYRIVKVKNYRRFAGTFYILDDGLAYDSCHFSSTYLK